MRNRKPLLRAVRAGYVTILSVIIGFGLSGLSFVYGWIWFGSVWGTIAAVLFLILLGIVLTPVADHIRYTLTKGAVDECLRLTQDLADIDNLTHEEYSTLVRKYFGL